MILFHCAIKTAWKVYKTTVKTGGQEPPSLKDEVPLPISWRNLPFWVQTCGHLINASFWWGRCHPGPHSGDFFSLPHRRRIPPAPGCQGQADCQRFVQFPPTLWPHDRRQHDLCRKPSEAWERLLPGQRFQVALGEETWARAYAWQRPDWEPMAGRQVPRLTCHKAKKAQAGIPVLRQIRIHTHPGRSSIVTVVVTLSALSNLILVTLVKGMSSSSCHRSLEKWSWPIAPGWWVAEREFPSLCLNLKMVLLAMVLGSITENPNKELSKGPVVRRRKMIGSENSLPSPHGLRHIRWYSFLSLQSFVS